MNKKNKISIILAMVTILVLFITIGAGCKTTTSETTATETTVAETTVTETTAAETTAAETAAEEPKTITYVNPCIGMSPDWENAANAFLAKCEELGYVGNVAGSDKVDVNEMLTVIETAIGDKVDGIVNCPLDPDVFKAAYKKANDEGILIVDVAVDSASELPNVISYIGTNYDNLAKMAAEKVIEKTGGKANIIIVYTGPEVVNQESEINAFIEATKDYPDIKIVDKVFDKSQVQLATDLTIASLTAHPEADFVWCVEGAAPTGVATAIKELKLTGKVNVLAIDMQLDTVKNIDEGIIWASVEQNFPVWGTKPVEVMSDSWAGNEVERIIDSGTIWWEKSNLDEFYTSHPGFEKNW